MVYYNKDDITKYSAPLHLNKVKAKTDMRGNYYSENDVIPEDELSESQEDRHAENRLISGGSYDPSSRTGITGRGKIQHNNVQIEDKGEFVDGRLKVDSWNLNYTGKKRKLRKKKITKDQSKKMGDLQNIYGVDA